MTRPTTFFKAACILACAAAVAFGASALAWAAEATSENNERLKAALQKYPAADANKDGVLTLTEAKAHLDARRAKQGGGWTNAGNRGLAQFKAMEKTDAGLWVASTGHSLVAPAMGPFAAITRDAGYDGHVGVKQISGGATGAPLAQWQRTGDRQIMKPALALGKWDVMTMGTHIVGSEVEDFGRWIELGLKHNPNMIFYIQDVWPRLTDTVKDGQFQLESYEEKMDYVNAFVAKRVDALNKQFGNKVFVIPVGNGMRELVRMHEAGNLPGIDAIHVSKNNAGGRAGLYRDGIHPSGPVAQMEGYIYFACIYKKNPAEVPGQGVKDAQLDKILRQVAWKVVTEHPHSGVK